MSLNSRWVAICFVVPALAGAREVRCPTSYQGAPLATVTLFDGPPSQHADLAPDDYEMRKNVGTSDWDVSYIFSSGRRLYIDCQYDTKHSRSLILETPKVEKCVFVTSANGGKSLSCK
jgi:hypothetical protein